MVGASYQLTSGIIVAVLVAATLPFAASIMTALSRLTRSDDVDGYFLYDRKLDIDGFIKTTIGYSLQVASIALFFYWTFTYGVVGPILVCMAWGGGFYLLAEAVRRGLLDNFLGSATRTTENGQTIHGYIGSRISAEPANGSRRLATAVVALASILGLGGTMMAEVEWTISYLTPALGLQNITSTVISVIAVCILAFTALYVLWGGYKSAVTTDRFQVPVAYVFFSLFTFSVAATVMSSYAPGIGYLIVSFITIVSVLLAIRLRLISRISRRDAQSRLTAIFTFLPIILLGLATVVYTSRLHGSAIWSIDSLRKVIAPEDVGLFGFTLPGMAALLIVNGVWQLIDISSLQRLQSLERSSGDSNLRKRNRFVAHILRSSGTEAALGWVLIIICAAVLKLAGYHNDAFLLELGSSPDTSWIIPIFTFTAFVYMLSTISGFISALSYISFYDIVPALVGSHTVPVSADDNIEKADKLRHPRLTTIIVISAMGIIYLILRAMADKNIPTVLYAIYAFQIVILPSALAAVLLPTIRIPASAPILSVAIGILTAFIATFPLPWFDPFAWAGLTDSSTIQVMPPTITALVAIIAFVLTWAGSIAIAALRRSLKG